MCCDLGGTIVVTLFVIGKHVSVNSLNLEQHSSYVNLMIVS